MNKTTFTHDLKHVLKLAWFLSWFILLAACTAQGETNPTNIPLTSIKETEIAVVTIDVTRIITKVATSEPTTTLTASPTASLTPTTITTPTAIEPTATPTVTKTPLPTATLTAEEMQQRWQMIDAQVEAIMDSNNGCQLPCWWGIEPGDSVVDARQIFNTINENGWIDSADQWGELQKVGFFNHFYRNNMGEYIYAGFTIDLLTQEEFIKVANIHVERSISSPPGTPEYTQISERLVRDWEQYSTQNIFEVFGRPELIYLLPQGFADGDNFSYLFNLYYPSLGIVVSYSSPLLVGNNGERTMCLNMFDMDSVDLLLYDPAVELPAGYVQATYRLWPLSPELKPEDTSLVEENDLESRTGMSMEEFVAFILEDDSDEDCFSVIWPYGV